MSQSSENSVLLTYLCTDTVSQSFMDSVVRTYEYEKHKGTNLLWRTFAVASGPLTLDKSRNESVKLFLEQSECEWLWIVDSDMGFKSETLSRMMATVRSKNLKVLSALYYGSFAIDTDFMGGWNTHITPVAYNFSEGEGFTDYILSPTDENKLVVVGGVGAGCMLIHRETLASMREAFQDHWFTQIPTGDGYRLSEDLSFGLRLRELGIPITVHTGIKASHHKSTWIGSK